MKNKNILIAGGGTGGHLFPALAIGDEITHREPNNNIHYIGSNFGLESKSFPSKRCLAYFITYQRLSTWNKF